MNIKLLIEKAFEAKAFSYSPYSEFKVGVALLGNSGKIYLGCNIENASYSGTNCAERTAIFKAVSEGEQRFKAIAIVGNKSNNEQVDYVPPCGICRQVMSEFCDDGFEIYLAKSLKDYKMYTLKELLPLSFTINNLIEK